MGKYRFKTKNLLQPRMQLQQRFEFDEYFQLKLLGTQQP